VTSKEAAMLSLILLLLEPIAAVRLLVACVFAGQVLALLTWDRLTAHEWKRADRLVTEAERGPLNVVYLAEWIEADHRERRLMRLLERRP
jgi:hypothetical protein